MKKVLKESVSFVRGKKVGTLKIKLPPSPLPSGQGMPQAVRSCGHSGGLSC